MKKILLIDDSPEVIKSLRKVFKEYVNIAIVQCLSKKEALAAIQQHQPDVLLLDHSLTPNGNEGLEIAEKLKKEKHDNILIFSTTMNECLVPCYAELGIAHVDKFDFDKLEEIIKS